MILIGIGSNIDGPWGTPRDTLAKAIARLDDPPCKIVETSSVLETTPFGNPDQPNFLNAVTRIETEVDPKELLLHLQDIERSAGRRRGEKWGPRTLDLDILDYRGLIRSAPPPVLPHPGIPERAFVLGPIAEIAPAWRHPILKATARELLDRLDGSAGGATVTR